MAVVRKPKTQKSWYTPLCRALIFSMAFIIWILLFSSWFSPAEEPQSTLLQLENVRPEDVLENPDFYLYRRACRTEHPTIQSTSDCYPDAPLRPLMNSSCTQLSHWRDIQNCLVGRRRTSPLSADLRQLDRFQIHVIGERNSGTKWLQQELAKCFPREKLGIRCHRDFVRSKHFFQPPTKGNFEFSIVIAIVRDPVEWVAAMRENPYHMPYHMNGFDLKQKKMPAIPLDWEEFIQRASPWTMPERSRNDLQIMKEGKQNEASCVQGFKFHEVVPCQFDNETIPVTKWRGHEPVYEMQRDGSGQPFSDLLKLRSEKILNFILEVPLLMSIAGYSAVRYEDLLQQGTQPLMKQVASMMGLKELPDSCKPLPPQPERLGHRKVPEGLRKWVEDNLVLETEQLLGYR